MGKIAVHEFITLDGVFDEPRWTMDYPFDPMMGEAIAAIMDPARRCSWGGVPSRCSLRRGRAGLPRTIQALRS